MTLPEEGARAPKFCLGSDGGTDVSLDDFGGKWLIVYFYPRDSTPGCTLEAQDFSRVSAQLLKRGAAVVGISRDSVKSHCTFRDKVKIAFPLLSDPELTTHRAYGAWGMKNMYGKKVEGTIRSTFLISPEGRVARTWTGVKVNGHVAEVMDALAEAQGGGKKGRGGSGG